MSESERPLRQRIGDYLTQQFVYPESTDLPLDECVEEADRVIAMVLESLLAETTRVPVSASTDGYVGYQSLPLICDWDRQKIRERIPALPNRGSDDA